MSGKMNRRGFLKRSLMASTGAKLGLSLEEKTLLAKPAAKSAGPKNTGPVLPTGKIGDVTISRLICGGNLISGFAHSRDLIYVSDLLRHYFTDDKCLEVLQLCEENGVNTAILRLDDDTLRILKKYWKERGGKIQWIAQVKPKATALTRDIDTWRCVHCGDNNDADGPPQCGCGEMKPGWDCCSWCESYGAMTTFIRDPMGDTICPTCAALRQRNTGLPLYVGALALLAVILVLWAIWVVVK